MDTKDHALAVIKAALNVVPLFGGSIASLIADYVPSSAQRATARSLEHLVERLCSLQQRIDGEAVNKEDFADLFLNYQRVIAHTNREEKLQAAANIVASALLRTSDQAKSSYEELDHLMRCLDTLSIGAITVLGGARKISRSPGERSFHFSELRRLLPQWEPPLIMSFASELSALALLQVTVGVINTPDYEAYLFQVTPMGAKLATQFIEGKI